MIMHAKADYEIIEVRMTDDLKSELSLRRQKVEKCVFDAKYHFEDDPYRPLRELARKINIFK